MGRGKQQSVAVDQTGWMIDNEIANFLLLHQTEVLYMCMLGYTFMHGSKVFAAAGDRPVSYKLVSMILACTGGGILVPLFINGIPVPLANDAYPIAILISFCIHHYFPIVGDVMKLAPAFKMVVILFYEMIRAKVVTTFTVGAAAAIAPSTFSFPVFGPIMCGTIAGCGGAFLPLNKGLDPIASGMQTPMITAFTGATAMHLFLNTSLSEGVVDAKSKAHLHLAVYFIAVGLVTGLGLSEKKEEVKTKKE